MKTKVLLASVPFLVLVGATVAVNVSDNSSENRPPPVKRATGFQPTPTPTPTPIPQYDSSHIVLDSELNVFSWATPIPTPTPTQIIIPTPTPSIPLFNDNQASSASAPWSGSTDWDWLLSQYDWPLHEARAVMMCESEGIPNVWNAQGSGAVGLFQIIGGNPAMEDPVLNTQAAYAKYLDGVRNGNRWMHWNLWGSCGHFYG